MENKKHSNHILLSNRVAFMVIGCLEAAWSPIVPYVKNTFSLDEGSLGLLMLCSGLGSVAALPVAGTLCSRYGAKNTVWASGFLMIAALFAISSLYSVWLTAVMLMIFGACTIFIDVSANVNGIVLEHRLSHHLMSGFHGGYSLGTLIGAALTSSLFSLGLVPWQAVVVMGILVLLAILYGSRGLLHRENLPSSNAAVSESGNKLGIPPLVIVVGLMCFVMYSAEGAVLGWGAVFACEDRGVDIRFAGFFYVAFAIMMTVNRFWGDWLVDRFGQRTIVAGGALLAATGFAVTALVPYAAATIAGFAMVGFGAANLVPQLVSFTGLIPGIAVQKAVSVINALGYSGILVGPVIIGFIAQHFNLETSFCCISVAILCVAITAFVILGKYSKK